MKGRFILAVVIGMSVSHAAVAGPTVRRDACPRTEKQPTQEAQRQQPATQPPQARGRVPDCRIQKPIPSLVDPSPFFLL